MKDAAKLWKDIAYRFAQQSHCQSRQVGAILVNKHDHLIAQGWNGAPSGSSCRHCRRCNEPCNSGENLEKAICAHAEANLLGHCAKAGVATNGATLYCTTRPCSECAKLIIAAGIATVIYFEDYNRDDDALQLFLDAGVAAKKG